MPTRWQWEAQSRTYGNYGNANQWTVNAGLSSLARETAQNTNDARVAEGTPELVYTFIRLSGTRREKFLDALDWNEGLRPHLEAMATSAGGAVTAGQLGSGLDSVARADSIVLLRVADYGCHGLTGPEFPGADIEESSFGNLIKLCRLDLFSGKDKAAGGSFGLGKAVYWRFSKLQTVVFNSYVETEGRVRQRLLGVNQGVMHRVGEDALQGRGYFGRPDEWGDIESVWDDEELVANLHLRRDGDRTGTSALLVGFYDPDRPNLGTDNGSELTQLASELREGLEENFWPLLTRGRLKVRIEVQDNETSLLDEEVDPGEHFAELAQALRRFDEGLLDIELDRPLATVSRDVPIDIARRKVGDPHYAFTHIAKLVVTLSDEQSDSLENRVCLFRRPEMVVETLHREFEGRTYHAFLLAGAAINPDSPTQDDLRADDFLRFAEPPSHDRWIPGRGRGQASQANLTANYVAPWVPNLRGIEDRILDALQGLFGAPPQSGNKPPEVIFKHLKFIRGETSDSVVAGGARRKPVVQLIEAGVDEGRWRVRLKILARNRDIGWSMEPRLSLVGLHGHELLEWSSWELVDGSGEMDPSGRLTIPAAPTGRYVSAVIEAVTTDNFPLPPSETMVEPVLRKLGPARNADADPAQGTNS